LPSSRRRQNGQFWLTNDIPMKDFCPLMSKILAAACPQAAAKVFYLYEKILHWYVIVVPKLIILATAA
jgi:hypothetical protein